MLQENLLNGEFWSALHIRFLASRETVKKEPEYADGGTTRSMQIKETMNNNNE